jgi:hypothetical protein
MGKSCRCRIQYCGVCNENKYGPSKDSWQGCLLSSYDCYLSSIMIQHNRTFPSVTSDNSFGTWNKKYYGDTFLIDLFHTGCFIFVHLWCKTTRITSPAAEQSICFFKNRCLSKYQSAHIQFHFLSETQHPLSHDHTACENKTL